MGGALEARKIPAGDGRLTSDVVGEIEKEGNVMLLKRIHVSYRLQLADSDRETAERVHGIHADHCPLARSIKDSIAITTSLTLEPVAG